MSNYFMAGVANAEIFDGNNNLFATAKALTDSSITIGVSAEEIRGGEGAALRGKYYHSSSFGLKMTSAMFELEYIAANVGAKIDVGADVMTCAEYTVAEDGTIALKQTAKPLTGDTVYAYISLKGSNKWATVTVDKSTNKINGLKPKDNYIVKYFITNEAARKIKVNSNFIPDTLYVILTAGLYAGDAKAGTGTKVGSVVIKVPRFQLAGNQELGMTMTGASTTNFEGSALAVEDEGCDTKGYYAEIIEVLSDAKWYDNARAIVIEDSDIEIQEANGVSFPVEVYAIYDNALPKKISNEMLKASGDTSSLYFEIAGETGLAIDAASGVVSGDATTGTATISVIVKDKDKDGEEVTVANLNAGAVVNVK